MDQDRTLKSFTDSYDIPYTVVTLLYSAILLLVCLVVGVKAAYSCCKEKYPSCKIKRGKWLGYIGERLELFNGWLIRLVFGKSEGVSEGKTNEGGEHTEEEQDFMYNRKKGIFINGRVLDQADVNILGAIIFCFGLLVGITSYSAYLLEVSHTCSEDTAIYCFPQFINQNDPENPNITQDEFLYPITDCNQWTNSSVSAKITFQCFRFAYDAQGALVVAGGLLAFFTIAIRIIVSVILSIFKLLQCCGEGLIILQVIAVILLLALDIAAALIVMSFQLFDTFGMTETEADPVAQQAAAYIADNGVQFLIIMGTATFLLLINWKKYAWREKQVEKDLEMKERKKVKA